MSHVDYFSEFEPSKNSSLFLLFKLHGKTTKKSHAFGHCGAGIACFV